MTDPDIDDVLRRLARPQHPVDPALLARITGSIQGTITAVEPRPQTWVLAGQLLAVCAAVAVAGAAWAGLDGVAALAPWQRLADFVSLSVLWVALARECVVRYIPGGLPLSTTAAVLSCWAVLVLLFTLVFRDYRAEHFVTAGLGCLEQGVLRAIPAAILATLVLRRGFATRPVLAGAVAGALAGLAGVVFLELHCSNVEAPHRLVWHAAVVPLSAALGALTAWVLGRALSRVGHYS